MIVKQLRERISKFYEQVSCAHLAMLRKRKLGFTFKEVYNKKPQIIYSIVADSLLKANEPLLESDCIRLPVWMSQDIFKSFIAKIN